MADAIFLVDLRKTYRKGWRRLPVEAVRGVTLTVRVGEAFGFIGPNGAGKSSTIRILTGLSPASGGEATLFGVPVDDPAARRGLGYVPENPYLYDYLTPFEILEMGIHLHRVAVTDVRSHILGWLDRLGLSAVARAPIRSFSKGMTQRVAIAQALAVEPRLLILDEPLSGLDPIGRSEVVDLLADYKRRGGTLFFTSHVLHDVERLADRFGMIHQGELRAVRSPAELVGDEDIVTVRTAGTGVLPGAVAEASGRWLLTCPRAGLWSSLDAARAAGHQIVEVRPALTLETAFLKLVGKS